MNRNWNEFNQWHLMNRDGVYLGLHAKLVVFVHDNPGLTFKQYSTKAQSLGIAYMSEEAMHKRGFCLDDEKTPQYHAKYNKARHLESALWNVLHKPDHTVKYIADMKRLLDEYEMIVTAKPEGETFEEKFTGVQSN